MRPSAARPGDPTEERASIEMERYYCPAPDQDLLGEPESKHALRVMRRRPGDRIVLFDGAGREWIAEVTGRVGRRLAFRRIAERKAAAPPWRIAIAQAVLKAKAMDLFLQKATELGVTEIFPVLCARSVEPGERAEQRSLRWTEIAVAAAKQSRRAWLPTIRRPIEIEELGRESASYSLRLFGSLQEDAPPLRALVSSHRKAMEQGVLSLIGPEGDFTPAERRKLEDAGFLPVSLSPTVLRSETAALFCAAVFLYEMTGGGSEPREGE